MASLKVTQDKYDFPSNKCCFHCGSSTHFANKSKIAKGRSCWQCDKGGHFAVVCKSKSQKLHVNVLQNESSSNDEYCFTINRTLPRTTFTLNNALPVKFLIDSGSLYFKVPMTAHRFKSSDWYMLAKSCILGKSASQLLCVLSVLKQTRYGRFLPQLIQTSNIDSIDSIDSNMCIKIYLKTCCFEKFETLYLYRSFRMFKIQGYHFSWKNKLKMKLKSFLSRTSLNQWLLHLSGFVCVLKKNGMSVCV